MSEKSAGTVLKTVMGVILTFILVFIIDKLAYSIYEEFRWTYREPWAYCSLLFSSSFIGTIAFSYFLLPSSWIKWWSLLICWLMLAFLFSASWKIWTGPAVTYGPSIITGVIDGNPNKNPTKPTNSSSHQENDDKDKDSQNKTFKDNKSESYKTTLSKVHVKWEGTYSTEEGNLVQSIRIKPPNGDTLSFILEASVTKNGRAYSNGTSGVAKINGYTAVYNDKETKCKITLTKEDGVDEEVKIQTNACDLYKHDLEQGLTFEGVYKSEQKSNKLNTLYQVGDDRKGANVELKNANGKKVDFIIRTWRILNTPQDYTTILKGTADLEIASGIHQRAKYENLKTGCRVEITLEGQVAHVFGENCMNTKRQNLVDNEVYVKDGVVHR